jgi:hypothetical protein
MTIVTKKSNTAKMDSMYRVNETIGLGEVLLYLHNIQYNNII